MGDTVVEALIIDLLEWVAKRERSYDEVMEAWRTSCPKLPVWEDANDRGLVMREEAGGRCSVRITASGLALLEQHKLLRDATPQSSYSFPEPREGRKLSSLERSFADP